MSLTKQVAVIFDKRKQLVMGERSIRCRLTGMRITNRIEFNQDAVPQVVEHVIMQSDEAYKRELRAVLS